MKYLLIFTVHKEYNAFYRAVSNFLDPISEIEMPWNVYAFDLFFNILLFQILLVFWVWIYFFWSNILFIFNSNKLSFWASVIFVYWAHCWPEFSSKKLIEENCFSWSWWTNYCKSFEGLFIVSLVKSIIFIVYFLKLQIIRLDRWKVHYKCLNGHY